MFSLLSSGCTPSRNDSKDEAVEIGAPTSVQIQPPVQITATQPPVLTPSKTPRTAINLDGYALSYKGISCPLKEVEFYDRYVFQADCADPVYIPQGTTFTLTFETPDGQPLPIGPVADLDTIFGALEPPFLFCQYEGVDSANTVTFGSPFQQLTGRDILCAFSVPLQSENLVIVLTGLTTR